MAQTQPQKASLFETRKDQFTLNVGLFCGCVLSNDSPDVTHSRVAARPCAGTSKHVSSLLPTFLRSVCDYHPHHFTDEETEPPKGHFLSTVSQLVNEQVKTSPVFSDYRDNINPHNVSEFLMGLTHNSRD